MVNNNPHNCYYTSTSGLFTIKDHVTSCSWWASSVYSSELEIEPQIYHFAVVHGANIYASEQTRCIVKPFIRTARKRIRGKLI